MRREKEAEFLAATPDDVSIRAVWAGEGVGLITTLMPAATIVHEVIADAAAAIRRGAAALGSDRT